MFNAARNQRRTIAKRAIPASKARQPVLEPMESRTLLSTLAPHAGVDHTRLEGLLQAEVSRPIATPALHASASTNTIQSPTYLTQVGSVTGNPGATVGVTFQLSWSDRIGNRHALYAQIDVFLGSTLITRAGANQTVIGQHGDTYAQGSFSYKIPTTAKHGSVITFRLVYNGSQLYGATSGSARVTVR